ncbi:hypothetical protein [Lactococcus fujiensis]|uniref:DUF3592 domain-containing protein n=2 Tax=Lactococcus fujiensis TaxID=610251 RepID=A0A2A5RNU6_9LACT|nr:hypothetical protein [Lactococcus fujiensis]PCS01021.1 hypothetical protein RT41_GL000811 [Lactococcus fujiensis JCM 16395]
MLVVAAALLAASISLTGIHMTNKNIEKTKISAVIVQGDDLKSLHEVRYEWNGKIVERRPLDVYFRKLGDIGDRVNVYVANDYPDRVFMSRHGDDLISSAEFMGGWGLLLLIILIGERQLLTRINKLEKLQTKDAQNKEDK